MKILLMNIRKNKTIRQILKAVPFVFALYSCDPSYDMQLCPSYVVCYNNLKAISMIQDVPDINSITIQCAAVLPIQDYTLKSTGNEYKEYVRLCKKHNDESFNQYRWFPENLPQESVMYIDKDFISIDVITETEYDSEHHAGSSLSDIIRFMSWSPVKFINSGYTDNYHYDPAGLSEAFNHIMPVYFDKKYFRKETDATCYPIDKMLKDLKPSDMTLLGLDHISPIGILYFEKTPEKKGDYGITLSMTTDSGIVLKCSSTMSF